MTTTVHPETRKTMTKNSKMRNNELLVMTSEAPSWQDSSECWEIVFPRKRQHLVLTGII